MPWTKEYYEANKEEILRKRKEWRKANKDRVNKRAKELRDKRNGPKKQTDYALKKKIYLFAKSDQFCADCGGLFPEYMYDLDHVVGEKVFKISQWSSKDVTPQMLMDEIDKCQVVCSNCHRVRTWKRRGESRKKLDGEAEKRKQFIENLKATSPCLDCGKFFHPHAMDFDHVPERGPKSFGLYHGHYQSWDGLYAEIAKCDLVCSNCHRTRTKARGRAKKSP